MSAFFGIVNLEGPVDDKSVMELASGMRRDVLGEPRVQKDAERRVAMGHLALGKRTAFLPVTNGERTVFITGHFRLDYRDELRKKLGLAVSEASDATLALLAYEKWGNECVHHLEGDWAMAVYNSRTGKVFLAKDALAGYSALYYTIHRKTVYFTSDLESLKSISALPLRINRTELARASFNLFGPTPGRTLLENVHHLDSGHTVEISRDGNPRRSQYRDLDQIVPIRYKNRDDYFEHFRDLFSKAVRTRLDPSGDNGIFLSGGLDSSAVAAFAADGLAEENRTLHSFTSVPAYLDQIPEAYRRLANERPLVESLASEKKNIHTHFEDFKAVSISSTLRDDDILNLNTTLATPNSFWVNNILKKAKNHGINRILNGQLGNPVISWRGSFSYPGLFYNLRWFELIKKLNEEKKHLRTSWRALIRNHIVHRLQIDFTAFRNRSRALRKHPSITRSILHEDVLNALDWDDIEQHIVFLIQYTRHHPHPSVRRKLLAKWNGYMGTRWHALALAQGITVADPTADWRLAAFSLGIPEELWLQEGITKYLYQKSIGQNVPRAISQNSATMMQSADLGIRLTKDPGFKSLMLDTAADQTLNNIIDNHKLLKHFQRFEQEVDLPKKNALGAGLIGSLSTCLLLKKNLSLYQQ